MTEDQFYEITAKLDEISLNSMTKEQGDKIIELLEEISKELGEFHIEFLKQ